MFLSLFTPLDSHLDSANFSSVFATSDTQSTLARYCRGRGVADLKGSYLCKHSLAFSSHTLAGNLIFCIYFSAALYLKPSNLVIFFNEG